MSGAERTRLYRARRKARQVEGQGLPTQAEWERAQHIVEVVKDVLPGIYERLEFVERSIEAGKMESVRSAHWDLKHLTYEIAMAVGAEHSIHGMFWRPGLKIWFDRKTKLPKSGREFPEGTETSPLASVVLPDFP